MSISYQHTPVLLHETVQQLITRPTGVYIDATCGLGGHSVEISKKLGPKGSLYCFDLDPRAQAFAKDHLSKYNNIHFIQNNFDKIKIALFAEEVEHIDGILYDLGISSMEIDSPERGFSFMKDGPLDMRMGETELSAADIVNTYSQDELTRIFREYGEESFFGTYCKTNCRDSPLFSHTSFS